MKNFNFFERLWEHSRTLRRVGLVLVMCLIALPQVWAYKITGGHTIYFDNYIAGWTGPQMQVKQNESNKPVYEFTQIGTTSFYYKVFSNDWNGYDGIYYFNWTGSNWGNKSTYERYDINSDVVIVAKSSSDNTAIGKFTTFQKAYPDNRIYFDATGATGWGDKAYFRYGFDCVAHADPMTKFPGTASLFYIDVNEAYFIKYTIANNAGWTKANTVYQPSSGCKPTGDYAITHSLNFSQSDINGGGSKITTCVITTPKSSTADGCDWYNYTKTGNASIPTQTVNVGSVSNGKIRVDYYNTSGVSTYWEGSGGTSLTVPQSAIITVTAIPNTGYYNSALTVGGGAFASGSTYTVTATTAIAATFARSYAFIEGRFRVYNAARNTRTSVGGQGSWVKNSTNIPMSFDGTNGRFELHTYSTPAELKAAFTGGKGDADPYFFIKTSTSSSSISSGDEDGPAEYWATSKSSNGNKLLNAGTANKRAVSKTSDALTFVGNSRSDDEYVILYCDGSYVWYDLEYTLEYSAGTGSGTAPASKTYYNKGSKATVASNTFTAPSGYHFHHWSGSDGKTYAASDKVTMNSNVTLTAIWALDYPTGYIYITDVMATPATKAGTTITATITSATYKSSLSSTFNTNRVGYEEWAQTTGSGNYNLAFSSALDLSSYSGGVDIDVWWGANDRNRPTYIKINGGSQQDLDAVTTTGDRDQVRKATYHTDVTSLSSVQVLGPSSSGDKVVWFRVGIKETPTYALTYDDNTDAEVSNMPTSPVNKPAGTITLASEEPTRSGYAFQGWTEDALNAGTVYAAGGSYTMPASAQTLYAKWAQTYTLTYDDGDGSGAPSAEEHVPGSITLSSTEPTRSGYVFLGWTVHGGDGTLYAAGGSYTMPSSDVTLDAEWEEICFQATITKTSSSYSVDGNSTKNITSDATITTGGSVICVNNNASSRSFSFSTDGVSPGTSDGYVEFVFPTGTILQTGTVIRVQGTADNASHGLLLIDDSGTTLASQTNNGAIKFSYEVTALSTINGNDHIRIKRANTSGKNAVKTIIITDCGTVSCTTSPTVEAASNSSVAVTTATVTCASGISSLGSAGCEISSYGFVLGTSSNPTTSNTTYEVGTTYTSTGVSFYKDLTGLTAGTTYYVRPYATNGNGTAYGTETYFTTSTVTMTPTLTNVTHTSGATSGIGGSNYTAVFTASTGYSMPNPTVTIGGNAATIVTDYTWSVEGAVGTITIPANKINGNIVITLNSAAAAPSSVAISGNGLYFAGETISLTATPTGGNGPVTYQWYKGGTADGNAIEGATNATYTKASCAFGDAGSYYCKVTCGGSQSTWGQSGNAYDVKIPRLYVKTGHYYDLEKSDFGNVDFTRATASTATASIVLGSNGDYCFNIADGCGHYYGNSGTMQYNNTGWITNVSPQDCGLTTTNAGTYIFTINYSTWSQLTTTITFPSCTDPGLAFASASKSVTLCDDAPTNALTNTHGVTVSYASSDETVATVASDGTLTIKKAGTTTITASSLEQTVSAVTYCADNASYTLTVNASTAAGLAYGTATMEKNVGDANFTNTLTNTNSLTGITYTSSNTAVATVDEDGEVTIKAAGTTTITAHSAQQKKSTTCYAAGSATYSLTVYNVYTVSYNAMGGTCSPTSANTTTSLGKVTLPTPTHASYSFLGWYNTAGTRVGGASSSYTPTANITLYAKWQGDCAGGGGGSTTVFSLTSITGVGSGLTTSAKDVGAYYDASSYCTLNSLSDGVYVGGCSNSGSISNRNLSYESSYNAWSFGQNIIYLALYSATGFKAGDVVTMVEGTSNTQSPAFAKASASTLDDLKNTDYNYYSTYHLTMSSETAPASGNSYTYTGTLPEGFVSSNWLIVYRPGQTFKMQSITVTRPGSSCYTVTYDGNGADGGYTNDPAQYAASGTVTVLANGFTKTGYAFAGWNTKADGSGATKQPGATFAITQDTTLHAQWKQIKYFTTEGNWNTSGNWSPSGVPAITDPVVIQANVTVDINNAKALRVDIETGKTLTINAGMALIIAETLTKNGGATEAADVIINSTRDAGVGALIIGSEAGDNAATMNFETKAKLVGGSTVNQFIGSPFSNAAPYVDYGQQLYKFCPKQNGDRGWWQSHTSLATMTPFWGYNVLCTETSFLDLNWTGKLNPSESKTITDFYYNGSSETDNMFANSWTAPIHVGAFEDGDFVNASTTLYMFNAGTPAQEAGHSDDDATNGSTEPGTYISIPIHSAPYAGIGVIPSMQAFYVLSTGSDASITLDYNKIVYTPALTSVGIVPNRAPKHNAEVVEPEVIKLHVQSETGWAANTYVMGRADFAEGYEDGWDGAYIEGESATPKLYTPSIDGNMFINCLPEIEGTVVGFRKGSSDNNYIFSFDYDGDEVWYLNDQKAQKSTQIMNGQTYAFVSEAGDNAARFVISATPINKIATGCESVGAEAAKVRKLIINDKVYIIRGGQVFDVLGKTIKK